MTSLRLPFVILFAVSAYAHSCFAADPAAAFAPADEQPARSAVDGFVFCSDPGKDQPVPVYVRLCNKRQVGTLNCGEKVEVLSRHDDMLRIASSERPPRFVPASAISQQANKFVAFDSQSAVPDRGAPDCSRFQPIEPVADGFVFCSGQQASAPVYFNLCQSNASGSVACGEKVGVISRHGDMLRVTTPPHDLPRYMASLAISQQAGKFVPFGEDSVVPEKLAADCSHPGSTFGAGGRLSQGSAPDRDVTPPHLIYSTNPEFTDQARRKKVQGVVILSLTVGADGLPHDITVDKGIGYGLDEKAVEAVSRWKFDPALKDGQPIDKQIKVEVQFHLY